MEQIVEICWLVVGRFQIHARPGNWAIEPRTYTPKAHRAEPLLLPVGQNVGKRNGAVRAAFHLLQKADCDRLGDRVARGCLAGVRLAGEHLDGSDTSATTFRNCLEDCLQDPLFGSTEHAEVSWQVDRLLRHNRYSTVCIKSLRECESAHTKNGEPVTQITGGEKIISQANLVILPDRVDSRVPALAIGNVMMRVPQV